MLLRRPFVGESLYLNKSFTVHPLISVGSALTKTMEWFGAAAAIVDEPILQPDCVGIPLCGIGAGMFNRLLSA